MRVNLGCGDRYAPNWVNVDHAGCPHRKDLAFDIRNPLPWSEGELTRIYMGHVLEHLKVHECLDVLTRLLPVTDPVNGKLCVVGPDVDVAHGMAVSGTLDVTLDSLRFGADRWEGDVHRWECSLPAMEALLGASGWKVISSGGIENCPPEWPVAERGPRWQSYVLAQKK